MAWALPGAIGAKLARPDARVIAATGDGAFLMNSQEIETGLRLGLPFVILVWVDNEYGLITWKMELELGTAMQTSFQNPDFELQRIGAEVGDQRLRQSMSLAVMIRTIARAS